FDKQIEECGFYEGYTLRRFIIISAASTVSFFGIIANCILLLVFIRSKPNTLYSAVLALLDALLCMVYLLLFGVDAEFVFLRIKTLFIVYHTYMIPVFILSRIVQFAMPYMLILATFERLVWTAGRKTRCVKSVQIAHHLKCRR
uniref:G-protein coupled receptors family 1 profile domain-containing protein n=1 Tax=Parascaris univalens TaxID=6257 RepID=A0A915AJB9_PARUN